MRTSRLASFIAFLALILITVTASAQDWRGAGRISGVVKDEAGQPLEGVAVKAHRVGSNGGPQTKTNKKGEWAFNGINGGQWDIDFDKDGYQPGRKSTSFQEHDSNPPMPVTLKKAAVDPNVAIAADLNKAAELIKAQKYADARAIYEDILAKHPEAYQVEPYIARTYYAEHNLDAAVTHLRNAVAKEPENVDVKLLLATTLAEQGKAEESQQLVTSIDEAKITNPATLLNIGIGMLNGKKPADALTWFNKTITRFPQFPDAYYYRGITELQEGQNDPAKADLSKFVEMAPNAPEAATAKGILEKLK